ncbi:hypothetical protein Pfo_000025 [Paulownia fortunei]|nr:hypothetical protein Pfo_000025 [Paulownia fortunei]
MKNIKGRVLRKLKSISTPPWRPGLVFQANTPVQVLQTSTLGKEHKNHGLPALIGKNLSISEIIEDVKEEELASGPNADSKEKFAPSIRSKEERAVASVSKPGKIDVVPMHDSLAEFDPSLEIGRPSIVEMESLSDSIPLPCLKLAAMEHQINRKAEEENDRLQLIPDFEDKCPPGGRELVVLYTTSLRGIRKTFEDCNTIRFLLDSFRVLYYERDVSMHLEYREELWRILGGRVVPPRLFIKGRYIGGADESIHRPCRGCAGMCFMLCSSCNGSRKVMPEDGPSLKCPDCNENGLIKCSVCSWQ